MTNKYKINFNNIIPTWNELTYDKIGSNMKFLELQVFMEVYKNEKIIYSIKLMINGIYCCCGSRNFDIDKINSQIIKDYDETELIYDELLNNYKDIFKNTVLNIWKTIIFDELCQM